MSTQMTFVACYRASIERQGQSGLGLDANKAAVAAHMRGQGALAAEFVEVASARKDDRPQFAAALAWCRGKLGRVLVIAKLDRLTRSVAFISNLIKSEVAFVAVDMPHANKLTMHVLAAVAGHKREMISQRTKVALAAAKARGTRLGNPRPDTARMRTAVAERVASFRAGVLPTIQALQAEGRSLRDIAAELNTRGIKAPRGGNWHRPACGLTFRKILRSLCLMHSSRSTGDSTLISGFCKRNVQ